MGSMLRFKNLAYSVVVTPPSPAVSGATLALTTGGGALMPAVPFYATVWPIGVLPQAANAEIVLVTNKATDVITMTRAQQGTSARTILPGDQFAATITEVSLPHRKSKTTPVTVASSVAEVDLLAGEFTVFGGMMGTDKQCRLRASGDLLCNLTVGQLGTRWKLKFGGTVVIDTGVYGGNLSGSSGTFAGQRAPWTLDAVIQNLTASTQDITFFLQIFQEINANAHTAFTVGVGQYGAWPNTPMVALGRNSGVIDTAADRLLEFSVINGVSSPSYDTKLTSATMVIE